MIPRIFAKGVRKLAFSAVSRFQTSDLQHLPFGNSFSTLATVTSQFPVSDLCESWLSKIKRRFCLKCYVWWIFYFEKFCEIIPAINSITDSAEEASHTNIFSLLICMRLLLWRYPKLCTLIMMSRLDVQMLIVKSILFTTNAFKPATKIQWRASYFPLNADNWYQTRKIKLLSTNLEGDTVALILLWLSVCVAIWTLRFSLLLWSFHLSYFI